tara:strand:+ start:77 stop:526 length:450 start_codon:yes stop_codon:yes gene_type:complete
MKKNSSFKLRSGNKPSVAKLSGAEKSPMLKNPFDIFTPSNIIKTIKKRKKKRGTHHEIERYGADKYLGPEAYKKGGTTKAAELISTKIRQNKLLKKIFKPTIHSDIQDFAYGIKREKDGTAKTFRDNLNKQKTSQAKKSRILRSIKKLF